MMQLPVCTTKKLDEHATFYDIPRRIHHGNPVFNSHILPTLFSKKKTHTVWCAFLFIINTRFRYPSPGEVPARFDAVLPFAERKVSNPSSRIRAKPHRGFAVSSSNLPVSTKKSEPKRVPTFLLLVYTLDIVHWSRYRPDLFAIFLPCKKKNLRSASVKPSAATVHRTVAFKSSNLAFSIAKKTHT